MTTVYSNEHGFLRRYGEQLYLCVPTQIEVGPTEEQKDLGLGQSKNVEGTLRLNFDRVSIYGIHEWMDEDDFGGWVCVIRYTVGGQLEMDKVDCPVESLHDLLAEAEERAIE